MRSTLIFLLLPIAGVTLGKSSSYWKDESAYKKCLPIEKDFTYEGKGRFFKCGGKDNGYKADFRNSICNVNYEHFLDYIVKVERIDNVCAQASDCTFFIVGGIPVYTSKKVYPFAAEKLRAANAVVAKICDVHPGTFGDHLSDEDQLFPHSVACISKRCVPRYEGKKVDFEPDQRALTEKAYEKDFKFPEKAIEKAKKEFQPIGSK